MTHIAPDVTARMTPEAAARFAEYLAHARTALDGCAELSPDEVEDDIRAHIAAEFPAGTGWVRLDQLEAVLARLGTPEQWVSDAGRSSWRRSVDWVKTGPGAVRRRVRDAASKLRHGPDDWRLAYLTFGTLLLGAIIFPLLVVLLPVSYILGRAAVSLARERNVPLGPQRWLVYPPLVVVSLPLLIGLLVWPIPIAVEAGEDVWRAYRGDIQEWLGLPRDFSEVLVYTYFIAGAMSLWGTVVGLVFWSFPRLPANLFTPFFSNGGRRFGQLLALLGGAVFTLWLAYTLRMLPVWEWAREWRRQAVYEDRVAYVQHGPEAPPRGVLEPRARKVASDFLRACRNRDAVAANALSDVPFYTGPVSGTLIVPDAEPIIRDRAKLSAYFDGQLRQVQRTDRLPAEVLGVVSYDAFKAGADVVLTAALDDVLTPSDFVVSVGRDGTQTGRVFLRYRNQQVRVVGMTK
jgi:hypothetical protein